MSNTSIDARETALIQSATLKSTRVILDESGALEIRTPVLSPAPDLAPVPQFVTVVPSTQELRCMRIAPEEALTRVIALGVPAVYEISNNFRAEECEDSTHLFEFDSVEALYSGQPLEATFEVVEKVCRSVAQAVANVLNIDRTWLDTQQRIPRIKLNKWIESELNIDEEALFGLKGLSHIASELGAPLQTDISLSEAVDHVTEHVASTFEEAVFLGCFPAFHGGPASRCADHPEFVERYELFFAGLELGVVTNKLSDIREWQARYENNIDLKAEMKIAPNFVNSRLLDDLIALPGSFSGFGLGLDRVAMTAAGCDSISMVKFQW